MDWFLYDTEAINYFRKKKSPSWMFNRVQGPKYASIFIASKSI